MNQSERARLLNDARAALREMGALRYSGFLIGVRAAMPGTVISGPSDLPDDVLRAIVAGAT